MRSKKAEKVIVRLDGAGTGLWEIVKLSQYKDGTHFVDNINLEFFAKPSLVCNIN